MRVGLQEGEFPHGQLWHSLSQDLSNLCRASDEKLFLMERLVKARTNEVQSLYNDLLVHRDHLFSALAALPAGFALFDKQGRLTLINPVGEEWLDWHEQQAGPIPSLASLGICRLLGEAMLEERFLSGEPLSGRGSLRLTSGSLFEADFTLHPILHQGRWHGSFLTFRRDRVASGSVPEPFQEVEKVARDLLETPLTPAQARLTMSLLDHCQQPTPPVDEGTAISQLKQELSLAQTRQERSQQDAQRREQMIEHLNERLAQAAEEMAQSHAEVQRKEEQLQRLGAQQDERVSLLQAELDQVGQRLNHEMDVRARLSRQIEELQAAENQVRIQQDQLRQAHDERLELQHQLELMADESVRHDQALVARDRDLEVARSLLAKSRSRCELQEIQLQRLRGGLAEEELRSAEAAEKLRHGQERIRSLESKLAQWRQAPRQESAQASISTPQQQQAAAPATEESAQEQGRQAEDSPEFPPGPLQHNGPLAPDQPVHPMRVLLVEDEPITQMVTQECVESLGHQCVLAGDGNEALKLVQRQPVDAVITSYHMPGINGVELCRRIRQMRPEAPPYCILLTSLEYSEEARQATEDGIDAILTKPLDTSELSLHLQTSAVNLRHLL